MIFGVILIFLEVVVPGGIIVFLGLSAGLISALVYFEIVTSIVTAITIWFIVSLFFMLGLRSFFMKYFI
ncbi:MAG: hypothetical protein COC23_08100 [Hyphomicrobiales bacterium]|nr:MAG: hypothetical protein COC23_08100 [Hyphomicrobiales bacterium]